MTITRDYRRIDNNHMITCQYLPSRKAVGGADVRQGASEIKDDTISCGDRS
jgi:hypothetical protein